MFRHVMDSMGSLILYCIQSNFMNTITNKLTGQLSGRSILIWRIVQTAVWLIGVFIVFCLFFFPNLGIHLFWNVLIPIAPLLLVVAVGIWRNVCPMASFALFPRHAGLSKRKSLSTAQVGKLNLIAITALFLIVPLRHTLFNTNAIATAILILSLALIAILVSFNYEWKSAWCSGLCPIHPVEKLYGINNKFSLPNAHCDKCYRCVTPCPDTTPGTNPLSSDKTVYHRISGFLMVGAFPGFVWGWFQVPDLTGAITLKSLGGAYAMPVIGLLATSALYLFLKNIIPKRLCIGIFSAAAVSCYYWYRLPALLGFGLFPGNGMLVDLTEVIPPWVIFATTVFLALFFFWWLAFGPSKQVSWAIRPPYKDRNPEMSIVNIPLGKG